MEPTYMKLELGRWGAQREEGEEERDKERKRSGCWGGGRGGNRHRVNVSKGTAVEGWRFGKDPIGILTNQLQTMARLAKELRCYLSILNLGFHIAFNYVTCQQKKPETSSFLKKKKKATLAGITSQKFTKISWC